MRAGANFAIFIVAVILGGVAAFLARSWLQTRSARTDTQKTVPILVATERSPLERRSAPTMRERWPVKSRPDGAFANFADLGKNGRRITISPFVRDEPIVASKVSAPDQRASLSTVIEKDRRAVWAVREGWRWG